MLRSRLLVLAVVTVALSACLSLDGVGYDASASQAPDAAPEPNAPRDAAAREGATGDSDAKAPMIGCPAGAFCSDFDDGLLPGPWTRVIERGGTARVVEDPERGRVLDLDYPGADVEVCLELALGEGRTTMTVDLDLRIARVGTGTTDIVRLGNGAGDEIGFDISEARAIVFDIEEGGNQIGAATGLELGTTWRHLRLEVLAGARPEDRRVVLLADGAIREARGPTSVFASDPHLQVGDCNGAGAAQWRFHIDRVVIDAK